MSSVAETTGERRRYDASLTTAASGYHLMPSRRPDYIGQPHQQTTPAAQQATSVRIIPSLNRKMATPAAKASASAQPSTLAGTGASNASGKARTGTVWRKMLAMDGEPDREVSTPHLRPPP
jgi:hypothetical protein